MPKSIFYRLDLSQFKSWLLEENLIRLEFPVDGLLELSDVYEYMKEKGISPEVAEAHCIALERQIRTIVLSQLLSNALTIEPDNGGHAPSLRIVK